MLNNAPTILPAIEAELVANGPAQLWVLSNALRWRDIRATGEEIEAALAVLIARGKVEVLPALTARNTRYAAI